MAAKFLDPRLTLLFAFSIREANIPGLLHFLYKLKTVGQWTAPAYEVCVSNEIDCSHSFP
jgi:hypothetical protein